MLRLLLILALCLPLAAEPLLKGTADPHAPKGWKRYTLPAPKKGCEQVSVVLPRAPYLAVNQKMTDPVATLALRDGPVRVILMAQSLPAGLVEPPKTHDAWANFTQGATQQGRQHARWGYRVGGFLTLQQLFKKMGGTATSTSERERCELSGRSSRRETYKSKSHLGEAQVALTDTTGVWLLVIVPRGHKADLQAVVSSILIAR